MEYGGRTRGVRQDKGAQAGQGGQAGTHHAQLQGREAGPDHALRSVPAEVRDNVCAADADGQGLNVWPAGRNNLKSVNTRPLNNISTRLPNEQQYKD